MARYTTSILVLAVLLSACDKKVSVETREQKASYAIGRNIGEGMRQQGFPMDADVLAAGIKDALAEKPSRVNPQEAHMALQAIQEEARQKRQASGTENMAKGEKFLEENKKKKGVKITKSGLQYEVITQGKGTAPKATDKVKVHYRGTLLDGSEFDSSYKRNQPAEFPLNGVIPGWTEGLQLMKPGGKWKLYIPSKLAYGEMGRPGIPPNSVLTFEIELLEVLKPDKKSK